MSYPGYPGGQYPPQQWGPPGGYPPGPPNYPANPYIPPSAPGPYPPPPHHQPHHHHQPSTHMHHVVQWVHSTGGAVPYGAVQGGYDDGNTLYVGRAHHDGDLVPGKIQPSHNCCYVAHGGNEHACRSYEVLTNPTHAQLSWVHVHEGNIPPGAVSGGHTSSGEPLYVGRHEHHGSMTIGKVQPSHNCLYIAYGGREISYHQYEVLCVPPTIY